MSLFFLFRVIESVHDFFAHRSHVAILNTLSHFTLSSIRDHLAHLEDNTPQSTPPHPLLYLSVSMAEQAFAAVQLLQSPKAITHPPNRTSDSFALRKIVRHMSLLTVFLSGVSCNVFIQTSREVQRSPKQLTRGADSKTILCSTDVLVDVHLPTVQVAIGVLVPREHVSGMELSLSGLPRQQSKLIFTLESDSDLFMYNLLEAGLKLVELSVIAKLLSSEVHEEMVFDWSHIHRYHDSSVQLNNQSDEVEARNNRFVVQVLCPLMWSQLASPQTGIAGPSTGGLDLLVLHEAMGVWQGGVEHLASVESQFMKGKKLRDKRVLLTLVANAARNSMLCKQSFNPVHSNVTLSLRHSVAYSCLHQLWETLPAFTESAVPVDDGTHTYNKELICSLLGIAVRLYSQHSEIETGETSNYACLSCGPMSPSVDALCDTQSVGYMSISPSPSELAIPNVVLGTDIDLKDIDYDPFFSKASFNLLLALRESLLPFYREAGMKIDPQLRAICHNSDAYLGNFSLNIRETNVVVAECVEGTKCVHPPVVLVRKFTVIGSLNYTHETTPVPISSLVNLLPKNQTDSDVVSKVSISSSCSVIVDNLALSITIPLLKLGRHMLETGHFRAHCVRQAKIYGDEQLITPCLSTATPQVIIKTTVLPEEVIESEVIRFTQLLVFLIRSREETNIVKITTPTLLVSDYTHSTPKESYGLSPPFDTNIVTSATKLKVQVEPSLASSVTSEEVAISMNEDSPLLLSPEAESIQDTLYDMTGDQHLGSSDEHWSQVGPNESFLSPTTNSSGRKAFLIKEHSLPVVLGLSMSELLFSLFGLLKVRHIECSIQIETTTAKVEFEGITGSVDTKKTSSLPLIPRAISSSSLLKDMLPTYLSVTATLQRSQLTVDDHGLPDNEVLAFKAHPVYASVGVCNTLDQRMPTYRCLLKLCGVKLEVKQSPVIVHKRYQVLMPVFSTIYKDVFSRSVPLEFEADTFISTTPTPSMMNIAEVKLPSRLSRGLIHFSLDKTTITLSPLPSLTVTYEVSACTTCLQLGCHVTGWSYHMTSI